MTTSAAGAERPRRIRLVAAGRTDVGRMRTLNEDSYLLAVLGSDEVVTKGSLAAIDSSGAPVVLMVADGVGGAASGEIASLMATDTVFIELRRKYETSWPQSGPALDSALRASVTAANHVIYTYATANPQHRGMATTTTLVLADGPNITVAQIGDSRAYLVHSGEARQMTKDQSLVQRLIDAGEITEGEAAQSERRNIILQALGSEASVTPDMYHERVEIGDVLVLCSDGLSNLVPGTEIARIALADNDMGAVADRLIAAANAAGGHDNITVVAARFEPAADDRTTTMPESASPKLSDRVRRWLR